MSLVQNEQQLIALIADIAEQKRPPIAKWDPPYRGHSKMLIKRDGSWWHDGTPIKKPTLVKLFAQILRKEEDKYFLVTPVEKQEITVEDSPFVIQQMSSYRTSESSHSVISFTTNTGDVFLLDAQHPLKVRANIPYALVRDQLEARLETNVYYQCVALAEEIKQDQKTEWWLHSGAYKTLLGEA